MNQPTPEELSTACREAIEHLGTLRGLVQKATARIAELERDKSLLQACLDHANARLAKARQESELPAELRVN